MNPRNIETTAKESIIAPIIRMNVVSIPMTEVSVAS